MDNTEYTLDLVSKYLEKYVPDESKKIVGLVGNEYMKNTQFLFTIYKAFMNNEAKVKDNEFEFNLDGENCEIIYKENSFNVSNFKEVIVNLLDILEPMLPLGSVVDLDKSLYSNMEALGEVENIRIVITHRFMASEGDSLYFPYAGVVYPTGMLGKKELLYFTQRMISKVVQRGYTNEQERSFVYLMKQEMIVENRMRTAGYGKEEEVREFNKRVVN